MFLYKATYIAFKVYIFYVLRMYFLRIEPKILASTARTIQPSIATVAYQTGDRKISGVV